MHNFKELLVWQRSVSLAIDIYRVTRNFPSEERFGITQQINRCVVSIASNIAEGAGRNNPKEFNSFLGIASGSSCELETQLIIANKIGLLNSEDYDYLGKNLIEIQKMIYRLQQSINQK